MKKAWTILLLVCGLFTQAQEIDLAKLSTIKRLDWSGSISASTGFYNTTGTEQHGNPFNWNINGNMNINILETLDLPFSFIVGRYQSSITRPYFQFGITPTYKWTKLHLGYRNLTFNPYTLAGHTFFGAGVELNPGKFRLAAMYGRLRSAVEIDTTTNTLIAPSFKRKGYGTRIGYGDKSNFIDLIHFCAKDDVNSIKSWQDPDIKEKQGDANALVPVENKVLGVSAKTTLWKKFTMVIDGGLSFYKTSAYKNNNIDKISSSQRIDWAGKTSIGYAFDGQVLKFDYERILPGYITLGSYFFNTDIENITFSPSGSLAKGKLVYSLSAGLQKNNLDNKKTATTRRFIANGSMTVNPAPQWGVDMNYNNFAISQVAGSLPLHDSVRIGQVNQAITLTPRFTVVKDTTASHIFSLTGNYNDVNDRNIVTKKYGNMQATMIALNHVSSFTRRGNSINSGLNYNNIKMAETTNTQFGATLGFTQSFFKESLSTSANLNYNKSLINSIPDGAVINGTMNASYSFAQRHSLTFSFNVISTTSKQFESYVETIGTIGYNLVLR
jgi:hypothetical protein